MNTFESVWMANVEEQARRAAKVIWSNVETDEAAIILNKKGFVFWLKYILFFFLLERKRQND